MKRHLIITAGTGKGVEYGLAKSVVVNNPESMTYIMTTRSQELDMPGKIAHIVNTRYKQEMPEVLDCKAVIQHEGNLEEAYSVTLEAIEQAQRKGFAPEEIHLDFTSGTKAMSVGAAFAALLFGCRTMLYVGGFQRDPETGRVITGTEQLMHFTLNRIFGSNNPQAIIADNVFQDKPAEVTTEYL